MAIRGVIRLGRVVWPPWAVESKGDKMGDKMNILNGKKYIFSELSAF